jgi:hypothetical protein
MEGAMPNLIATVTAVAVLAAFALPPSLAHAKEKQKPKHNKAESSDYLIVIHTDASKKKQPDPHKGQSKPSNTLSR